MTARSYIVFSFRGRDFLSVPARPSRLKSIGVRLYKETLARRRLFKTVIRFGMFAHVDRFVGRELSTPVPKYPTFDFEGWIEQVRSYLTIPAAQAIVSFPGQARRARFYVNLVSPKGDPLGFAKISLDSKNDGYLATESKALRCLASQPISSFRVPRYSSKENSIRISILLPKRCLSTLGPFQRSGNRFDDDAVTS